MNDALLAALVAFCVTLLAFLFWPVLTDQFPDLAVTAAIYVAVLLVVSGLFRIIRQRPRK